MIYLITFLISIMFVFFALKVKKDNKKLLYYIFLIIGLVTPCVVAGLRNINVGFDTHFYVVGLFNQVKNSTSIVQYIDAMKDFWNIQDVLYLSLTFFVGKIFNNFNILLFFIELLIIIPVYKSICKYTDNCNVIVVSLILFYLFWYNATLNMVRQSLAIAFSLLSIACTNKEEYKKSILYNIVSIGFHETAILTVFVNFILFLFNSKKISDDSKEKLSNLIIALSLVIVLLFFALIFLINNSSLIKLDWINNSHYITYIKNCKFDFSFIDTTIYSLIIFIVLYTQKYIKKSNVNYLFARTLSIVSIIVLQIGAFIPYSERISYYLIYPLIINIIPNLLCESNSKKIFYLRIITLFVFFGYWILYFVILGIHDTFPYKFCF